MDISVTPQTGTALKPAIYVRAPTRCTSFGAGDELTCIASSTATVTGAYLPNQQPGTYSVFVDSNGYETGPFTLTVRLLTATPPAPAARISSMAETAEELFSLLMGDEVEPRREFIEKNALHAVNLDT